MNDALSYLDGTFADKWRPIYIDGQLRHATCSRIPHMVPDLDGKFFVDSTDLPFRRCSQHELRRGATAHLESGGRVKSGGTWYSLKAPKEPT